MENIKKNKMKILKLESIIHKMKTLLDRLSNKLVTAD